MENVFVTATHSPDLCTGHLVLIKNYIDFSIRINQCSISMAHILFSHGILHT